MSRVIQDTVSPDSWVDTGGTYGTLKWRGFTLIVVQTLASHRLLASLLEQLRDPSHHDDALTILFPRVGD